MKVIVILSAIILSGCATSQSSVWTLIQHPMESGVLEHRTLGLTSKTLEEYHGLPKGSLRDEVTLVEASNERLCFGIKMSRIGGVGSARIESYTSTVLLEDKVLADPDVHGSTHTSEYFEIDHANVVVATNHADLCFNGKDVMQATGGLTLQMKRGTNIREFRWKFAKTVATL